MGKGRAAKLDKTGVVWFGCARARGSECVPVLFMDLGDYENRWFDRGRPGWMEALWMVVQWLFVSSWIPGSRHRLWLLRGFGAVIGRGVVAKPGLKVKFPWKLEVGEYTWLGENVWVDNLDTVAIGDNVCISQGAYLCTGSHDWASPRFDLITRPIRIASQAWIGARSIVAPGVTIEEGAVLALGSVATRDVPSWQVAMGVPAKAVRQRVESR